MSGSCHSDRASMSKLVLNVKCLLLLSFLTATEFYNLGHIQGIIKGYINSKEIIFLVILVI